MLMIVRIATRKQTVNESIEYADELDRLMENEEYPRWWFNGGEWMKYKMRVVSIRRKLDTAVDSENFK